MNNKRNDNLLSVFNDIHKNAPSTRKETAKRTQLSVVTICKLIEQLRTLKLTNECITQDYKIGRNTGLLYLSNNSVFLVIDLTHNNFEYSIINLSGMFIQRDFYFHNPTFVFEDNLRTFLNTVREVIEGLENYTILNIGILLPEVAEDNYINLSNYKKHSYIKFDIEKAIRESLNTEQYITKHFLFCAFVKLKEEYMIEPDDIYVYFSMMQNRPSIVTNSALTPKLLAIGDILVTQKLNYSQILKMTPPLELLREYTETALSSLVSIINPKAIFIDDDKYTFTSLEISRIENFVRERTESNVKIVQYNKDCAALGLVRQMTEAIIRK